MKRSVRATATSLLLACTLTGSIEQAPSAYEREVEKTRDLIVAAIVRTANRLTASQIVVDSESPLLEGLVCRNNDDSDGVGIVLEKHSPDLRAPRGMDQLVRRAITVEGIERVGRGYQVEPGTNPTVCYTKDFVVIDGQGGVRHNGTEMMIISGSGDNLELCDNALGSTIELRGGMPGDREQFYATLGEFEVALSGLEHMASGG